MSPKKLRKIFQKNNYSNLNKSIKKSNKILNPNKHNLKNMGFKFLCTSMALLTSATAADKLKTYVQSKNNLNNKNISNALNFLGAEDILSTKYNIDLYQPQNIENSTSIKEDELPIVSQPTTKQYSVDDPETIKLMSFNLEMDYCPTIKGDKMTSWDNRKTYVVEQIKELNPSIICFQEVTTNMNKYLSTELENYEPCFFYRVNSNPSAHSLAIYYNKERFEEVDFGKIWLSETPEVESESFDGDYRICCWEKLRDRETNNEFVVCNTHYTLKDKEAMNKSSELINQFVSNFDVPVFLMGDFNSHQHYPCYPITTEVFDDSSVIAANVVEFGATYNGYDKKYRKNNPIDRIFCKRDTGIKVLEYELCNDYTEDYIEEFGDDRNAPNANRPYATSDHFPVTAIVVLENEKSIDSPEQ